MDIFPSTLSLGAIIFLGLVALWDGVWKAIGMWKSARNNQLAWFVCILLFNTAGILPIVYLAWFQKRSKKK